MFNFESCDFLSYEILVNNICERCCVHYCVTNQNLKKIQFYKLLLISCPNQTKIYAILCLHFSRVGGIYQNLLLKMFATLHARVHLYDVAWCIAKYFYAVHHYFLTYSKSFLDIIINIFN